jgi:hypothetical protein
MSNYTRERREIKELPAGAMTVAKYAESKGCHYTNIYKLEEKGKVEIVKYSGGGLFVIELQ